MTYAKDVTELIGNTPLVKLNVLSEQTGATILGKCEFTNPTSSVKDRIGANMIKTALADGSITKDTVLIEPTSGNTGIALASVAAALGMRLILTMPSSMSIERRKLLAALGAELVLTEPEKGMGGAVVAADELAAKTDNAVVLQQFANPANPQIHRETTALEILKDTDGKVDIFIAAIGTGGTITGVGEILKKHNPDIKIIAIEPENSQVLAGKGPGPHKVQGIGAGFVPKALNTNIYDELLTITNEDAKEMALRVARDEGLLVGISSGCNLHICEQVASREENRGKVIVTMLNDTGERYLSSGLFE